FNKLYGNDHLRYVDTLEYPKYIKNEKIGCPYIVSNLIKDSKRLGLLIIVEQNKVIDDLDMLLCKDLTEALNAVLYRTLANDLCDYIKDIFFIDALEGKPLGIVQAEHNLNQLGWNKNDKFVVFVVCGKENDTSFSSYMSFLTCSLINTIPGIKVLNFRNTIVAIVNLKKSSFYKKENLKLFVANINQRNFICGFSKVFNNFLDIQNYYQQACFVTEQNTSIRGVSVHYEDYLINHMTDAFSEKHEISCSLHPAIDKLARHDLMHKSDLIVTFYTY
ncbi:MAG: hypothetical protein AAGU75_10845, partial [Bacillota bacterium]